MFTTICLDFINENKNDIDKKKKANTTTTATDIFKCYENDTLFDTQNAGDRISKLLDFTSFWGVGVGGGGHAPRPSREKESYGPFSGHSHLLLL